MYITLSVDNCYNFRVWRISSLQATFAPAQSILSESCRVTVN